MLLCRIDRDDLHSGFHHSLSCKDWPAGAAHAEVEVAGQ